MMNEYFCKIYCINLDRRQDRWVLAKAEFDRLGLDVQRIAGVDIPKNPGLGCSRSHELVLEDILYNGYDRVLILEDDVVFKLDAKERFSEAMLSPLARNWDMIYFGGNHAHEPTPTDWLHKVTYTLTTSHFAITGNMASKMLSQIQPFNAPVDMMYAHLQPSNRCYTFYPGIATQRTGWSDIERKNVDYDNLIK